MTYSLNEIEAMGKRAARGAGRDWGIAEEAGKAARWLAARGLPGPELLAGLLERHDGKRHQDLAPAGTDGTWRAPAGPLCPLVAGAALSDRAAQTATEGVGLGPVSFPLLLAPYLSMAARETGSALALTWTGVSVTIFPDGGLSAEGTADALAAPEAGGARCCAAQPDAAATLQDHITAAVDPGTWRRLDAFAQRTFAPATEASRLMGAGAGLSDND